MLFILRQLGLDLMAFQSSDLNVPMSQELASCLITASKNNLFEIQIKSWKILEILVNVPLFPLDSGYEE